MEKERSIRRMIRDFNHDWLFQKADDPSFCDPGLDDSAWRRLNLPHDFSIETVPDEKNKTGSGGGYTQAGCGWYRKHFEYDPSFDGRLVSVLFDGIYMDSTVYLNGIEVGREKHGYSSFWVDFNQALKEGENVLAVRVDNSSQPNSRWYSGSGIYRNVSLVVTDPVHIEKWGVFFSTDALTEDGTAKLTVRTQAANESTEDVEGTLTVSLKEADGKEVLSERLPVSLSKGEKGTFTVSSELKDPVLWTDREPYLYTLTVSLCAGGEDIDETSLKVGIRTAVFDADKGFLLNGERVKIKGMCLHHDCGLTGAVGYRNTWERRLKMLKEMGCNGIRCAHNPPSPEFLDLCDELGFLVMDEAFDEWRIIKDKGSGGNPYGTGNYFDEKWEDILTTMLRRDRNHPSVVLWSIGNEIPEQSEEDGVGIARRLQDICHSEDPGRMVTSACDRIAATHEPALHEFEETLDVVGYNYVDRWRERAETIYDEDRRLFPKRRFIGSENAGAGGDRGVYVPRDTNLWSRYDYRACTLKHEWLWRYTSSRDFVAGDYQWTGIDYLGESEWPRRGNGSGAIDSAGFAKDTYYYFRSVWNKDDLTLHILPHWNWPGEEGTYKQVIVYTNCDSVDLYINDRLVGSKACGGPYYGARQVWNDKPLFNTTTHDLHLTFDVLYEPGTLKAVGYKDGKPVLEETVETTLEPVRLVAKADREIVSTDEVVHIELSTLDSEGRDVPTASPFVECKIVSGPAHLVGMDAGDMYDLSLYSEPMRRMHSGRLMAMIMADAPGEVQVRFSADGLEPATVTVTATGTPWDMQGK